MTKADPICFESVQPGDRLPETRHTMDAETYQAYNRLVEELNPLHLDREYARSLGYRDIVVAGVYTFSFIPRMIENWTGADGRINTIDIRFHHPVYLNQTIFQTGWVADKRQTKEGGLVEIEVQVKNEAAEIVTAAMVAVSW